MKFFIRAIIAILVLGGAFAFILCSVYGDNTDAANTSKLVVCIFIIFAALVISSIVIQPDILLSRIYAIGVCIAAHRKIRRFCTDKINGTRLILGEDKKKVLAYYTGCYSYPELYKYASKIAYFKR